MSNRKPASAKPNQGNSSALVWRDARYHRFYEVVDQLVIGSLVGFQLELPDPDGILAMKDHGQDGRLRSKI